MEDVQACARGVCAGECVGGGVGGAVVGGRQYQRVLGGMANVRGYWGGGGKYQRVHVHGAAGLPATRERLMRVQAEGFGVDKATSLMRNQTSLGPYHRTMHRAPW